MSKEELKEFFTDLEKRGLIANKANLDSFFNLEEGQKKVYLGIDCTAESLHIGHLLQLAQTFRFLKHGFEVFVVLGGSTSKIGDPSDKTAERKPLDEERLAFYQEAIKKQLKRLVQNRVTFKGGDSFFPLSAFYEEKLLKKIHHFLGLAKEPTAWGKWNKYFDYILPLNQKELRNYQLINNKTWLDKLSCVDFLEIVGRNTSMNYLLDKEWIRRRMDSGLSYLAFSYSLLQAYDFYYLYKNRGCHGQLGGGDQFGNMTNGLRLIRSYFPHNKAFVFNFPLLTNSKGEKLSKTQQSKPLSLNDEAEKWYDFFRNMSDVQALDYVNKFTFLSSEQIKGLLSLNTPPSLRILQRILLELFWLLNFKNLNSLKKMIEKKGEAKHWAGK